MDILNTKAVLALGISGAMSIGTAAADTSEYAVKTNNSIVAVSSPDLRVTVYDGIATLLGTADSGAEARAVEKHISDVDGVEHVINMITWN